MKYRSFFTSLGLLLLRNTSLPKNFPQKTKNTEYRGRCFFFRKQAADHKWWLSRLHNILGVFCLGIRKKIRVSELYFSLYYFFTNISENQENIRLYCISLWLRKILAILMIVYVRDKAPYKSFMQLWLIIHSVMWYLY